MTETSSAHSSAEPAHQRIALVDLLDRVLATGVVVSGEVILSIADVDLVHVSLQALISSVRAEMHGPLRDTAAATLNDTAAPTETATLTETAALTDTAHRPEEG